MFLEKYYITRAPPCERSSDSIVKKKSGPKCEVNQEVVSGKEAYFMLHDFHIMLLVLPGHLMLLNKWMKIETNSIYTLGEKWT